MIRVRFNFGGRMTNEQRIEPGDYVADDERLHGLAEYLVANGIAEIVADEAPADEPGGTMPPASESPKKRGRGK